MSLATVDAVKISIVISWVSVEAVILISLSWLKVIPRIKFDEEN